MLNQVILVDKKDNSLGTAEKLEAHRSGLLHRAFSIFIFNSKGELLLQERAKNKYHSGGLWANTCCSHPRPDEKLETAVHRRLQEEMGFDCPLKKIAHFVYLADVGNGLIEHELDHVFVGTHDGDPTPNPQEIEAWKWIAPETLLQDLEKTPQNYGKWLPLALKHLPESYLKGAISSVG